MWIRLRSSIPLAAVVGDERVAAREREHDLAADAGGGLAAAVGENDDAEALARDHADIGRGVAQPAVLVDEGDVAVAHHLPGERLGGALIDREHALLRQRHRLLQRALVRQRAETGGEEGRHIAGGGIHLPGPRPVEHALLVARRAHGLRIEVVALHRAAARARALKAVWRCLDAGARMHARSRLHGLLCSRFRRRGYEPGYARDE